MNRKFNFSFILLIALLPFQVVANFSPDTIRVESSFEQLSLQHYSKILRTNEESPELVWQHITNTETGEQAQLTVGYITELYWLTFSIKNGSDDFKNLMIEVGNPQIDYLDFYETTNNTVKLISKTGDKLVFSKRLVQNKNFIFPIHLSPGETKTFLLKVDKRNSSLNFPIELWDATRLAERDYDNNLGYGIYFGIILLCLLYAALAFIFLKQSIYIWYFLWIMGSALYVGTALGFSFQYIYPNTEDFNSYFRVYLMAGTFLTFIKFSQQFLSFKSLTPLIHKITNYIFWIIIALMIGSMFAFDFYERNSLFFLPLNNLLALTGGLLVMLGAVITFKRQPKISLFFLVAFSMLAIGFTIITLSEFGVFPADKIKVNPVLIGSCLEILLFSLALTYQVKKVYDERNDLSLKIAHQQKDLLRAYVEGVEKERERISRELHDNIGSRLSSLKRFFFKSNLTPQAEEQIDILCEDVRTMSHQMAPPSLKIGGLRQLLRKLVLEIKEGTDLKIDIQYYDVPEELNEEYANHIYRIVQEGLNNILKHAQATQADIQLFGYEQELILTIEDNGKGFDPTRKETSGIGLKNIKARAESLNGVFEISSNANFGTNMMIRIPLAHHTQSSQ